MANGRGGPGTGERGPARRRVTRRRVLLVVRERLPVAAGQ
jgi:hypothetical protein